MKKHNLTDNGWLSPTGVFYKCYAGNHYELAEVIAEKQYGYVRKPGVPDYCDDFLYMNGWLKCQNWGSRHQATILAEWYPYDAQPTQSQLDVLHDWCIKFKKAMPKFDGIDEYGR